MKLCFNLPEMPQVISLWEKTLFKMLPQMSVTLPGERAPALLELA